MKIVYLDTSAIVKRYIEETGSEIVHQVYEKALLGETLIAFSTWNIVEAISVFNKYVNRGFITESDYNVVKQMFLSEIIRLTRLRILKLIPVKTRILMHCIQIMEKHKLYVADALQIVSAKEIGSSEFYTADKRLYEVSLLEGLNSVYLG